MSMPIVRKIKRTDLLIIEGLFGCGKTIQVPQHIFDDSRDNNRPCNIVIAQPHDIGAVSAAHRVCEERGWSIGSICGYETELNTNVGSDTVITYTTNEVLLKKFIVKQNLSEFTHIIVDEVHERNRHVDFLLLMIRKLLDTNFNGTKIIIMSATINVSQFLNYFSMGALTTPISIANVLKESRHSNSIFYIEKLKALGSLPLPSLEEPKFAMETYRFLLVFLTSLNFTDLIRRNSTNEGVLIFFPGVSEIKEAHDRMVDYSERMREIKKCPFIEWHILELHSSMTVEEQRKVFDPPPPDKRKIILSTNIADSTITIPDIRYVVDFCLTKSLEIDPETQCPKLKLRWASQMTCAQRAARVGRTCEGRVYRLIPAEFFQLLPSSVTPEIVRYPLDNLVLSAKMLDEDLPPKAVLEQMMEPPVLSTIGSTISHLKEVGGLSLNSKGERSMEDGDITMLGRVMAALPQLDINLTKLIVLGFMFGCLNDCIIMATGCLINIFKSRSKEGLRAYLKHFQRADGSTSDLIAYLNLYNIWDQKIEKGVDAESKSEWCESNCLSQRKMSEWRVIVKKIKDKLARFKITQLVDPLYSSLKEAEIYVIRKVLICGAFYPNYFKQVPIGGGENNEPGSLKVLGGLDPKNTVFFTGFDNDDNLGILYTAHIKKYFQKCVAYISVSFDENRKVYAQFSNPISSQVGYVAMPGKISPEVYRSIRLRQLKILCFFEIMDPSVARKYLEKRQLQSIKNAPIGVYPTLEEIGTVTPRLNEQIIHISVSEWVDAGHFWAHNQDTISRIDLVTINNRLNSYDEPLIKNTDLNPYPSLYYAARYAKDGQFYRCKILLLVKTDDKHPKLAKILFIDYGTLAVVSLNDLYMLPNAHIMDRSPIAMECYLKGVQPLMEPGSSQTWSDEASKNFEIITKDCCLFAKVYSVVNEIVHLELYKDCGDVGYSINSWLVKKGYAELCEESSLSKANHLQRLELLRNPSEDKFEKDVRFAGVVPPISSLCDRSVQLKGPFSPLEMKLYSMVNGDSDEPIPVHETSVNIVILDNNNLQDTHDRLLVAGKVGKSCEGSSCLYHTTVMPNIKGLPTLMALLFCPNAEMKPSENGERIASILCGLATADNQNRDISIVLDTKLTQDDINKVNEIRHWMNVSVQSMSSTFRGDKPQKEIEECQRHLTLRLLELIKKPRISIERNLIRDPNTWSESSYSADLLEPDEIWPPHSMVTTNENEDLENIMLQLKIDMFLV